MNNIIKKIFILILIIIFVYSFSASYSSLSIDNLAFTIALGIDKSDTNNLKVTFEFILPSASNEGSADMTPIFISVDCSSITNGINMVNAYLDKKVNLSHCKIIVFSEEIAKEGISDEVYSLINEVQIRPSAHIAVSKCDAKYYLENSEPSLESLIPKYYESFPNTSKYTGEVSDATIGDFLNCLTCIGCEPHAILGSLEIPEIKTDGNQYSSNIGTAVFKSDKLVGELDEIDTICFLSIENKVDTFLISVPDPEDSNSKIDIYLTPNKSPKINVSIIDNSPYIELDFNFSGKVYSMSENSHYLDDEIIKSIEVSSSSYLKKKFYNYLYKTSTTFKSDINGFGRYSYSEFLTTKDFNNFNWLDNYKNSSFNVNTNVIIDSGFLLNQT